MGLQRHDRSEIGLRSVGSVMSVRPGFGIGTHFATFHAVKNTPYCSRFEKWLRSSFGTACCIAATIR